MSKTIRELALEYYKTHPKQPLEHGPVVDWITKQYLKDHENPPRDPWRTIRQLHQDGFLIKVKKGVYKYDPDFILEPELEDFTQVQKEQIFERDGYRCVICGLGRKDGVTIHADHIKPKDKGGKATVSNGQTLCSTHNLRKKTLKQTETGKKMFIRLYEIARKEEDIELIEFCEDVLKTYEAHDINSHIEWEKG